MMSKPDMIVSAARAWLGTPFHHQASCRGVGADCLGLIRGVWRAQIGAEPAQIPPYSPAWGALQSQELLWQNLQKYFSSMTPEMQPDGRLQNGAVIPDGSLLLFRLIAKGAANHLGIAAQRAGRPSFIHACHVKGVCEVDLTLKWRRRTVAIFGFPQRGF